MRGVVTTVLGFVVVSAAACVREPGADPTSAPSGGMAPAGDLTIRIADRRMAGPDSIVEGWTRFRVEEDSADHIVFVVRLAPGVDPKDLAAFYAAFDTTMDPPPTAIAVGGVEVGDSAEVHLDLTPGNYLVLCPVRGADRHRHSAAGESRLITVVDAGTTTRRAPPTSVVELSMGDFAYTGAQRWPAGRQMVRVRNIGEQDHQVRMARLGPGMSAYFPAALRPGRYVVYCLISDRASGNPHVMLGMFREIVVE